jgi:hypothetical protein
MKNIHILPTDKPSRLYSYKSIELFLHPTIVDANVSNLHCQNQNIYITSDEEIKEGGYVFWEGKIYAYREFMKMRTPVYTDYFPTILTTDQDLIKNGVQAIDNEFLEWFVKNPSCESVEVKCYSKFNDGDFSDYKIFEEKLKHINKIIIPQEEPKQDLEKEMFELEQELDIPSHLRWHNSKPKQETLEEAAERLYPEIEQWQERYIFNLGAKWQAERMYSDIELFTEELKDKIDSFEHSVNQNSYISDYIKEWFEQFKK